MKFKEDTARPKKGKELAAGILSSQVIGDKGYVYCIDSHGDSLIHPMKGFVGSNFSYLGFIREQMQHKPDTWNISGRARKTDLHAKRPYTWSTLNPGIGFKFKETALSIV